jgi:hypothetical protein
MSEEREAPVANEEEEGTDFSFDPGSQVELEVEDTCCITGEKVTACFCRFPDYIRGTMMVMSRKSMLKHLRQGDTIQKFKEVLVNRHGAKAVEEKYSDY